MAAVAAGVLRVAGVCASAPCRFASDAGVVGACAGACDCDDRDRASAGGGERVPAAAVVVVVVVLGAVVVAPADRAFTTVVSTRPATCDCSVEKCDCATDSAGAARGDAIDANPDDMEP